MRFRGGQRPQSKVAGIEQACGMTWVIAMMRLMIVLMRNGVVRASSKADGRKQQETRVYSNQANDTEPPLTRPPSSAVCRTRTDTAKRPILRSRRCNPKGIHKSF